MIAAQNREQTAKLKLHAAQKENRALSESEKKRLKDTTWERRAAEKVYYSQSGRGSPPWEISLQRWALLVAFVGFAALVIWRLR